MQRIIRSAKGGLQVQGFWDENKNFKTTFHGLDGSHLELMKS
tara:strand:+ start:558 stop:683 length:126 start_codon:yes stop_codon:yes gene_type:complete